MPPERVRRFDHPAWIHDGVTAILLTRRAATVGVAPAYALARGNLRRKTLLDRMVNLPLVLPPVVTGYMLLLAVMPTGPIGGILQDWLGVTVLFCVPASPVKAGISWVFRSGLRQWHM